MNEVWNGRNADLVDDFYAPDFVCHFEPGEDWLGPEGVRAQLARVHESLEDFHERVDEMFAEGDRVAARTNVSGFVTDEVAGTRKRISTMGLLVFRISEGRIAEQWEIANVAGMVAQLR